MLACYDCFAWQQNMTCYVLSYIANVTAFTTIRLFKIETIVFASLYYNVMLFRPPVRSNGRSYVLPLMFFFLFFRPPFSELPRPIALKLCHIIGIYVYFIMQVQKLGGPPPKNSGAKNMQNFGRFWTISDYDCEYLRNGSRYPKSGYGTKYGNSSCV